MLRDHFAKSTSSLDRSSFQPWKSRSSLAGNWSKALKIQLRGKTCTLFLPNPSPFQAFFSLFYPFLRPKSKCKCKCKCVPELPTSRQDCSGKWSFAFFFRTNNAVHTSWRMDPDRSFGAGFTSKHLKKSWKKPRLVKIENSSVLHTNWKIPNLAGSKITVRWLKPHQNLLKYQK